MAKPELHRSARPPTAPPTIAPILVVGPSLFGWAPGSELPEAGSAPPGLVVCFGLGVTAVPGSVELDESDVEVEVEVEVEVVKAVVDGSVMMSASTKSVVKAI